jgi:amino acid adenylation domain-containing protein
MKTARRDDDEWQRRLSGREFTSAPRWTRPGDTADGTGVVRTGIADELTRRLEQLAESSGVPLDSVLLAVHLRVLGAVSSEKNLLFGYRPAGSAQPLPYDAELTKVTWRDLVRQADERRTELAGLHERHGAPAGLPAPVVLDAGALHQQCAPAAQPAAETVLRVGLHRRGTALEIEIWYRTEAMQEEYATRLTGYWLAALAACAGAPDTAYDAVSLLSEPELRTQLHALAGKRVPAGEQLTLALFEEQVALHPDAVAVTHGGTRWTYRSLDEHANQVARALHERGVTAEDVVAVAMERNPHWIAAMLGIFKAGGVYLPLRPEFPAQRIGTQLDQSGCRYALTEDGSDTNLLAAARALSRPVAILRLPQGYDEVAGDGAPDVTIEPGQLAYIYFTSGSTGAPKGAMCEHAGMLNHLLAKVEDMRLGPGDVVTQTASQCFDISLWQVVAPLICGGSVHIVDTEVQLDVDRFLDEVVALEVSVAQLVPSYFEVLTARLSQQPRALGRLRSISVTGEALKLELVQRWFALHPDITLVNAYGATEVSDDTMHEVLSGVPERPLITVGRSLRNVNTYILDENLRLVPLGSPGEISFSGVCVGRGYINDEERTQQAFVPDPYRPGTRMYRTGDFGRWLPEGRIEFLGRRDEQVKVRGYRIEIGEIENRLLAVPGVRDAAVVITGGADGNKTLVAFYRSAPDLGAEAVKQALATSLPDYMVPTYCHRLDALPLTENGKTNKKVLTALAGTLGHAEGAYVAPNTPTERRIATAWAEVLNVPLERIGRRDDFFHLGGTSLAAVRLVVKMDRLFSLKQLVTEPVLADLAARVDASAGTGDPAVPGGPLQRLGGAPGAVATMVCFPYAGGNAVNFQQLAKELERDGVAVYGVELPGHDLTGNPEPFAGVPEVARQVAAELLRHDTPVMLWGHCAGAAHALQTARLLEEAGRPAHRVFLAAMLLGTEEELDRESAEVTAAGNQQITERLLSDSAFVQLDDLQPERSELVGSAYRHDVRSTNDYLRELWHTAVADRLGTTLDVVVAADDPSTAGHRTRHRDWNLVAADVRLHELARGGHYFARTRAVEVAGLVTSASADLPGGQAGHDRAGR